MSAFIVVVRQPLVQILLQLLQRLVQLFAEGHLIELVRYNTTARTIAAEATGTVTTDIPAVTTLLSPRVYCSVGGTSSIVGVAVYGMLIKLDY